MSKLISTRIPGAQPEPEGDDRLIEDVDVIASALESLQATHPELFLLKGETDEADDEIDLSAYDEGS